MPQTDARKPSRPLDASVFEHMSELGQVALSSFVGVLVKHGDLVSLKAGLDSGYLDGLEFSEAAGHCGDLLATYSQKVTSADAADKGLAELEFARDWAQRCAGKTGGKFTEPIPFAEAIAWDLIPKLAGNDFENAIDALMQPQFGLELQTSFRVTPKEAKYGGGQAQFTLLGIIANMHPEVALNLVGPSVEYFPDTMAAAPESYGGPRVALNLAEQIVFFQKTGEGVIEKLVASTSGTGAAKKQLGDLALALVMSLDETASHDGNDRVSKVACNTAFFFASKYPSEDISAVIAKTAIALIGTGVEFSNPDLMKKWLQQANGRNGNNITSGTNVSSAVAFPLPHFSLYLRSDACSTEIVVKALSRMITEGGVALGTKDYQGRSLLQTAAAVGHKEAVEALLGLGADPNLTGEGRASKTAIQIAEESGHQAVASMLRASRAQSAIDSVLAKHKSVAQPSKGFAHV